MKFCSECAHPVQYSIPEGDNRERAICTSCGTIHYVNPRIVAGTLPVFEGQILLCKRAIEPRKGYWTLPAGFMENGEGLQQGAARETLEEAGINVTCGQMLSAITVPFISQVHIFFFTQLDSPEHALKTSESLEVKLFNFTDIPWTEIAFPTVKQTIEHYLNDVKNGEIQTRIWNIDVKDRIARIS
ncbi:NUDIX hydrolase [Oceaniserpentilla sp. 4NH20-0058]|uniref:NUDIX hydrolase n=1 Tax=Oceaniserpentilla sp. 4NH20-0058 TaxID=3127660 RepID=UPI0031046C61